MFGKYVYAALGQLTALTVDPSAPAKPRAQTIIAAFKHVEGIDRAVLEKLTAAGLVTVDQIEMARPDEIAAVTGLFAGMHTGGAFLDYRGRDWNCDPLLN